MSNESSLNLFIWYLLIGICLVTVSGLPCYGTENFTANSVYARNREILLSSLASNVAQSEGFFYTTETGEDPDKVYGGALCGADATAEQCFSCVNSSSHAIKLRCPNKKQAYLWDGTPSCLVRYTNRYFLGTLEMDVPIARFYNVLNITSNMTEFDQIWGSLMENTANEASTGSSKLKFGTQEANLTSFTTIYALMQCGPDLSQSDCKFCLQRYTAEYQNCCRGKQGGGANSPNCMLRWDLYPFYREISIAPPPTDVPPATSPSPAKEGGNVAPGTIVIIIISTIVFVIIILLLVFFLWKRKQKEEIISNEERLHYTDEIVAEDDLRFNLSSLRVATNDFSADGKLGQGGFGAVYKGTLSDGQDIAVKRLSNNSGQGEMEFKNEVVLVAKLQHRNLVRLLGFCFEGNERLLIYEYVPNSSLEKFIFDQVKCVLDWETRYKIIGGIARGLLYLHEDSRLRVIHRDLKASNILLDANMNPKISDFGMARLFAMDQIQGDTNRIVGTYGYMAPEYVTRGQFSIKSDVFSFGVLLLEIISGQKNSSFHISYEAEDLLTYAWRNWREGTCLNLIDPKMKVGSTSDVVRCIHIGLLCVQENAASRPTMNSVVLMLTSSTLSLALPSRPAFYIHETELPSIWQSTTSDHSRSSLAPVSNEVTVTELEPR